MTESDPEFLSVVFGPFSPFVFGPFSSFVFGPFSPFVSAPVNTRNHDLSTPSTCDESFLFRVLSLPCGSTIKIPGSLCRLSVCTHVTALEFLNEFPCSNLLNPNISACTYSFKVQNRTFFPHFMYMFCVDLRTHKKSLPNTGLLISP